jgi:hypothetical protein
MFWDQNIDIEDAEVHEVTDGVDDRELPTAEETSSSAVAIRIPEKTCAPTEQIRAGVLSDVSETTQEKGRSNSKYIQVPRPYLMSIGTDTHGSKALQKQATITGKKKKREDFQHLAGRLPQKILTSLTPGQEISPAIAVRAEVTSAEVTAMGKRRQKPTFGIHANVDVEDPEEKSRAKHARWESQLSKEELILDRRTRQQIKGDTKSLRRMKRKHQRSSVFGLGGDNVVLDDLRQDPYDYDKETEVPNGTQQ